VAGIRQSLRAADTHQDSVPSWRYARERIDILIEEFPELSHEVIVAAVREAGDNDMECEDARAILNTRMILKKAAATE